MFRAINKVSEKPGRLAIPMGNEGFWIHLISPTSGSVQDELRARLSFKSNIHARVL